MGMLRWRRRCISATVSARSWVRWSPSRFYWTRTVRRSSTTTRAPFWRRRPTSVCWLRLELFPSMTPTFPPTRCTRHSRWRASASPSGSWPPSRLYTFIFEFRRTPMVALRILLVHTPVRLSVRLSVRSYTCRDGQEILLDCVQSNVLLARIIFSYILLSAFSFLSTCIRDLASIWDRTNIILIVTGVEVVIGNSPSIWHRYKNMAPQR